MAIWASPASGEMRCYPKQIYLNGHQARVRVIVQDELPSGKTVDLTGTAKYRIVDPTIATIDNHVVAPLRDGQTTLEISSDGRLHRLPVIAIDTTDRPTVSFRRDVLPILTKYGCNSGACHGSAAGQDGFSLSLFGFDPASDYQALTREWVGRRVERAVPEESLLLRKATAQVPHTGGKRIDPDSSDYQIVLSWIAAGARDDAEPPPGVVALTLFPEQAVLPTDGQQWMSVIAKYDNGEYRDVTQLCKFESSNETSAHVLSGAKIAASVPGETLVTARFDTRTVGLPVIVLPEDRDFHWDPPPPHNYLDLAVQEKLKRIRIHPAEICDDETFLRRVTLDLCGRLPTADEYREFIPNQSANKRSVLIDRLIESDEFIDMWAMRWADVLQLRAGGKLSKKAVHGYYRWLRGQFADRVPLDTMAKHLITASGGTFENAEANYFQTSEDITKLSENVAQVFLGMRLQCAACHNHPFDRWTMDDYYGFAAFFAQLGRKRGEDPRETIIFNKKSGEITHPVNGRQLAAKFLGGEEPIIDDRDRRDVLADWLAAADNPYFARHMANTIWSYFFHRGIVHNPDDVRVSNPPVNPDLLAALATNLVEYAFDLRPLVRDICNSRTYQARSTQEVRSTDNFSAAELRRLPAAVLLDAISQVTESPDKFEETPMGVRAVQLADAAITNPFLTTFGRSPRQTVCTCETKLDPTLSQSLHLLNGDTIHNKIRDGRLIERRLEGQTPPEEIIDELYIRCLTRKPSEAKKQELLEVVAQYDQPLEGLTDVFWSLLNSREFSFNH